MTRGGRRRASDVGETLLELLISIVLLGIAATSIFGLMTSSIDASVIHQKQSVAGSILDNFAEYLQNENVAPYVKCPGAVAAYGTTYRDAFLTKLADSTSKVYEPKYIVGGTPRYTLTVSVEGGVLHAATDTDPATVTYGVNCASVVATDPAATSGLEKLLVTVSSTDSKVDEKTVIVKRTL